MCPQHLSQGIMHQVSGGMVCSRIKPCTGGDHCPVNLAGLPGQSVSYMKDQLIFFLCVCNRYLFAVTGNISFISYLSAALSVKRRTVKDKLVLLLSFPGD